MAIYTEKLGLKMPAQTDFYNVDDFNENFRKIDENTAQGEDIQRILTLADPIRSNCAPTTADKQYAGKLWVVPKMIFNNMMPNAITQVAGNWHTTAATVSVSGNTATLVGNGAASTIAGEVNMTAVKANDIVYIAAKMTVTADANGAVLELLCGDEVIATTSMNIPVAGNNIRLIGHTKVGAAGALKLRTTAMYNSASAQLGKGVTISDITILDLTADMCQNFAGIEFSKDAATTYIDTYGNFQTKTYELSECWWICRGSYGGQYSWQRYDDYTNDIINTLATNTINPHINNKNNPHLTTLEQAISASGGSGVVPVTLGGTGAANAANARTNLGVPPTSHAVDGATYGKGSGSVFGHVKLSDNIEGTNRASTGIAASEYALGYLSKVVLGGLDAFTFSEISTIAASGKASAYFKRGDIKNVTLKNNEVIQLEIADFNHDDLNSGGKAPISFIVKNCLLFTGTRYMNSSNTNVGGWNNSYMRGTVMAEILAQLPDDLVAVIKQVKKYTTAGNQQTTIQTTVDKLWLPSCIEVGTITSGAGYVNEGSQYPIFTDNNSRIKMYNGSASNWWLRSPYAGIAPAFYSVHSDGSNNDYNANTARGVVFGLCI